MKVIEVKKDDLKHNLNIIRNVLKEKSPGKNVDIIAVVKANGMGLDLMQYSKFLIENGITCLAVATYEEAIALREAEIKSDILLMSPIVSEEEVKKLIDNDIILTIGSKDDYDVLISVAKQTDKNIRVHIKIDTGFARYGFLYYEKHEIISAYNLPENVKATGIYTHFSNPRDEKWTNTQFERFKEVIEFLNDNQIDLGTKHCCSSTAFIKYPHMYLDAIRVGSIIQGRVLSNKYDFKKVGTFKSNVQEIKMLPTDYNVSYSNTFKTRRDTKIAVIPVGYYDGLNRNRLIDDFSLKNKIIAVFMDIKKVFTDNSLRVKINNENYKVLGRLGMYHAIVDITGNDDIKIGSEVILDIAPLQASEKIRREYV